MASLYLIAYTQILIYKSVPHPAHGKCRQQHLQVNKTHNGFKNCNHYKYSKLLLYRQLLMNDFGVENFKQQGESPKN